MSRNTRQVKDNHDESNDTHYFGKQRNGNTRLCLTEERAPKEDTPKVDIKAHRLGTHGFIPLWDKGVVLQYRFNERSLERSRRTKQEILKLFHKAVSQWGDAVPVMFLENRALWDFEFVVRQHEDCNISGCVLASAFFPSGGQQKLTIYPTMLDGQSENDQVETLAHELGRVFGLRHWFAESEDKQSGGGWRSELFGSEDPFTIMNYGNECMLTDTDKKDLKLLYAMAWSRELTKINGTPIVLFKPFSAHAPLPNRENEP
ncbi:peptidase M10A and M12B matrixin and adamalysin [Linnemannia elongata]|nr:peptidase M10A and M12B matrixin and adamalysin [Linnemannia elongata]